jgi:hypothetical protein
MGNPNVNGLPHCQLRRLQNLVSELQDKMTGSKAEGAKTPGFWIDTLCIPVGEEYEQARKDAIVGLTRVFQEATAVLVVDAELTDVSIHVSDRERDQNDYLRLDAAGLDLTRSASGEARAALLAIQRESFERR